MEFAWSSISDVALNLTGYLAAGALALVVYRIFKDRSIEHSALAPAVGRAHPQVEAAEKGVRGEPSRLRFVKLGEASVDAMSGGGVPADTFDARPSQLPGRAEIIRLAKRMLDSGASETRIRQVLPVSETELALLSHGNRR